MNAEALRAALTCGRPGCPCGRPGGPVHCPGHDDRVPSLSVSERDGKLLVHCHGPCSQDAVIEALRQRGLWPGRSPNGVKPTSSRETRYPVRDADGGLVAVHVRRDGPDGKRLHWERPDGAPGLGGLRVTALPLYRVERLRDLPDGALVLVTEGEKAADAAARLGVPAVGTVTGAAAVPDVDVLRPLARLRPVLWPDNDEPGRRHMERVAATLAGLGAEVRILTWPEAPEGGDAADFVALEGEAAPARLRELLAAAEPYRPEGDAAPAGDAGEDEGDGRERKPSMATTSVRLALAEGIELFHSPSGEPFATVPVGGHRETYPTRSAAFRRWIERIFYGVTGKSLNASSRVDAVGVLEGMALFDGPEHPVFVRVAEVDGAVYVDLGDPTWRAVRITADGWDVVEDPPVKFRRPRGLLPLPEPVRGGTVEELFHFLNVQGEQDRMLVTAWLVAALRGTGPYPVLTFMGEQGSAKSTAVRICAALVDPGVGKLRAEPREPRDLMIAATNGWTVGLDNISRLPEWLSDGLCRLATGGGFATRELYSDTEETIFEAQRPVVLNGITEFVTRPDLLDRAILVTLPAIPEERRRPEAEFWAGFEAARPRLQGALYDAVASSLRNEGAVQLERLPRMADFAVRAEAAAPALGWAPGAFLAAYTANRAAANTAALEDSPIADLVMGLAAKGFDGTATELLVVLEGVADERALRSKAWPKTPRSLSNLLRRLAPNLRAAGVVAEFYREAHTGKRKVAISASPASPPSPGGQNPHGVRVSGARAGDDRVTQTREGDATGDANAPRVTMQGAVASPLKPAWRKGSDDGDAGDARFPPLSDRIEPDACALCGAGVEYFTTDGEPRCGEHAGDDAWEELTL